MDHSTNPDSHMTKRPRGQRRLLIVALITLVGVWAWFAATGAPSDQGGVVRTPWETDHGKAMAEASASGRPILVNFTGSDWCGWCVRLREQVFDTGIFASWAKDNVVLLECDFPRTHLLPPPLRKQNEDLANQYGVDRFPTVVLITATGEEIARGSYRRGGAALWIADFSDAVRRGSTTE